MTPQELLRDAFVEAEADQLPISVAEIIGEPAGESDPGWAVEPTRPPQRGWMLAAASVLTLLVGLGVLLIDRSGGTESVMSDDTAGPTTPVPLVGREDGAVVGDAISLADGGAVRVNAVTPDAVSRYARYADPDVPSTEVEIEWCAGDDATPVDLASTGGVPTAGGMSHERWTGVFDDGSEATALPSYWLAFTPTPGGCVRGHLVFESATGARLVETVLAMVPSASRATEQIHSWDLTRSHPVDGPLRADMDPGVTPLGDTMDLDLCSNSATVSGVERVTAGPDVDALDSGRALWEISAQLCSDSGAPEFHVDTFWLISTRDNYVGNAGGESNNGWDPEFAELPRRQAEYLWRAGGLEVDGEPFLGPLAPGECVQGTVRIELPETAVPADVVVASGREYYQEIGRTRLDG